ncbi:tryptophan halogenase family protein [Aurantiacibacter luteus]|uniref:Tryptophan halogenase n=1 Tax=Aurantiacibacter luteus TaxID=1581420 RepID=A0A0G9MZ07_9SPHN|nr:tryptophan halogenase family protein [Aurantiacibacter luteus]KLE35981.1 tryptophan halogenase [Aurantiacibacter luteus]
MTTASAPYDFVIAGGGTAGWMCAAALARFTPPGSRIALVESEAIGTVGVGEATIPQIHLFNGALGLDEAEFLRETKGSFKLGISFDGWLREGESYMHAFGNVGRALGTLPFQHYWLRAKRLGLAKPLQRYSLNELAARTMRMQRGRTQAGQEMPYAYHFDAGLYANYLRRYAEARGVERVEGVIEHVALDGESGAIAALRLDGNRELPGRFFFDCTGFRALLIGEALGTGFDDWSHVLPCDRAMAVPCAGGGDFTPFTRSIARQAGWQWRIPLQHRIGNGLVYSSAHLSDDEASATLLANLDGEPQGDLRPIRFTTGKRRVHWQANCLALGLAAGFMEPLESTSIHLVQSAISRFLAVMPAEGEASPAARDWFNGQAAFEWERIRDFLILHYTANRREGEPFWDHVRHMALPETLVAKLALWREAGFIHREHEELFTEVGWFQVLAGQGVEAEGYNPLADALPEADLAAMLAQTEAALVEQVKPMPRHLDFLADYVGAQSAKEPA